MPDENKEEHLYAKCSVTKTLDLDYERGIALFNDSLQVFEPIVRIDKWLDKVHSSGHPLRVRSDSTEYFYIFDRYGIERVAADIKHIINPESYEHFTCLIQGSKYNENIVKPERDLSGKIVYGWKSGTDAISPRQQNELMLPVNFPYEKIHFRLDSKLGFIGLKFFKIRPSLTTSKKGLKTI